MRGIPRGRKHGFTLLELLVTVGLLVIVLGLSGSTLISSLRSTPRTRLRAEQEIELLRVTSVLQRQVQTVARSLQGSSAVSALAGKEEHAEALSLLTAGLLHASGVGLAEWSIVHDKDEAPYLAYRESPYDGGLPIEREARYPFSRLVQGLEVRFYSAPDYVQGWQRQELPERIRLTLYYPTESGTESTTLEIVPGLTLVPRDAPDGGLDLPDASLHSNTTSQKGSPSPSPTNSFQASPSPSPSSGGFAPGTFSGSSPSPSPGGTR